MYSGMRPKASSSKQIKEKKFHTKSGVICRKAFPTFAYNAFLVLTKLEYQVGSLKIRVH
jgi:hypothetical protein